MPESKPSRRDDSLSWSDWKDIERVCDRFEAAWDDGGRPSLDVYLVADAPEPKRRALVRDLLIVELDRRSAQGERPSPKEYHERFPLFHSAVAEAFAAQDQWQTIADSDGRKEDEASSLETREAETLPPAEDTDRGTKTLPPSSNYSATDKSLSATERLSSFRDAREVGRWQYGRILEAKHPKLKRWVRIAVLDEPHAADPHIREAFLARVRCISLLEHPHVESQVWEAVEDGETVFVVLERPRSKCITQFLPRTKEQQSQEWFYPNQKLARRMLEAVSGLMAIHERGIQPGVITADRIRVDSETDQTVIGDLVSAAPAAVVMRCSHEYQGSVKELCLAFAEIATGLPRDLLECGSRKAFERFLRSANHELSPDLRQLFANAIYPDESKEFERVDSLQELARRLPKVARCNTRAVPLLTLPQTWRQSILFKKRRATHLVDRLPHFRADRVGSLGWSILVVAITAITVLISPFVAERPLHIGVFIIPFLFVLAQPGELLFGYSFERWMRGYRLLDRSGAKPVFWRRLCRPLLRLVVVACIGGPVELVMRRVGPHPITEFIAQYPFLVTLVAGAIGLFCTSLLFPLRRPLHDQLTGTTIAMVHLVGDGGFDLGGTTLVEAAQDKIAATVDSNSADQLDQFALLGELGRGGMGTVFVARDTTLDRTVAIKTISSQFAQGTEALKRFEQEARLAAQLSHENVAKVYGVGGDASPYLVMECIEGQSLAEIVKQQGAPPIADSWDYIMQAARGLREAHKLGIIHRDIKPANLMIEEKTGLLKVMDFGLSKLVVDEVEAHVDEDTPTIDQSVLGPDLTRAGSVMGTPMYMSPEQASSKNLDVRSDIYSLGMTLYFLLAGKTPFESGSTLDLIIKQCSEAPASLRGKVPGMTEDQLFVLERMIAKDPDHRYPDYDALIEDLSAAAPAPTQLAEWSRRSEAVCLTACLGLSLVMGLEAILVGLRLAEWIAPWKGQVAPIWLGVFCSSLVGTVVYILPLWKCGQTPGKWFMRVKVIRMDGKSLALWQAIVRYLLTFGTVVAGGLIVHAVGPIDLRPFSADNGFFRLDIAVAAVCGTLFDYSPFIVVVISTVMIRLLKSGRGIHDFAAGTKVVEVQQRVRQ